MSSDDEKDTEGRKSTYATPKLTAEELEDWREDCRLIRIITQLRRYLSQNEYSPNKWEPLLKGEKKPDSLRIEDSDWEEARRIAQLIKNREDEETYEDDFEEASSSSSSSSSSSTSCESSSSVEYGALRVTSPFSTRAKPDQPCLSIMKEPKGKQPKKVNFNSDLIYVKDFYVSPRERRMKSEACPPEMVRRNDEEVRLEFMLSQINLDETADLDRLVFRKLKFKTVHMLEHGERGSNDDLSRERNKKKKVPTYAEFLEKSKFKTTEYDNGKRGTGAKATDGLTHTATPDKDIEVETNVKTHDMQVVDAKMHTPITQDEFRDAEITTLPDTTPRAESTAYLDSSDDETPKMTNEEIIAKLEEKDTHRNVYLQGKSYSADSFKAPAGSTTHRGVKLQPRHVASDPFPRLNRCKEASMTCTGPSPVPTSLISGDIRRSAYHTAVDSVGLVTPNVTSRPKHTNASAYSERVPSPRLIPQPMDRTRLYNNHALKENPNDCNITPRGTCRVIHVQPAPGTEFDESSEEEIEETKEKYDRITDSQKTESRSENGTPYQLSNAPVQPSTAQTERRSTRRPRWRRRIVEAISRRLRSFGDRLKNLNCASCL